jgi:hypothetical protein
VSNTYCRAIESVYPLSRERARRLVRCYELSQASVLVFQILMGVAPYILYSALKNLCMAVQHGPAGIAATPIEPKHLGTRLHRWNHAKPAPSHDPPSGYPVATITNARYHKGVATAELRLSNRVAGSRRPTSAASAHFSLFSMASERRSKERRHAMEALARRSQGRATTAECPA